MSAAATTSRPDELAAVLFDMDGTLLDSERLWDIALHALAAHHGGRLSATARREMVGRGSTDTMAIFYRDLGLAEPDPVADARFIADRMVQLFDTELRWQPGAAELLGQVRAAGVATALVTSSARRLADLALDRILGRDRFDAVVCASDVHHPKPHPESYRRAADRLRVPVHRCVAIEDSPAGIASATAAGAVVVAVAGQPPLGITGAHLVGSLTELSLDRLRELARAGAGSLPAAGGAASASGSAGAASARPGRPGGDRV